MPKGVVRAAVYLLLIIPLVVLGFLIAKHIQFAYELKKIILANQSSGAVSTNMQHILTTSEASTRSFFLVFLCFLMILCGLFIALRSTESAFRESADEKTRYALRTAYPGIIMAAAGCILLTYSVYKSSQLQLISVLPRMDTTAQIAGAEVVSPDENIVYQANLDTSEEEFEPIALPEEQSSDVVSRSTPAIAPQVSMGSQSSLASMPTAEDIRWADQLAKSAIKFGYYPTRADNDRYNSIMKQSSGGMKWDTDLHWAYRLLQKTQAGYQPTANELHRYEDIVGRQEQVKSGY